MDSVGRSCPIGPCESTPFKATFEVNLVTFFFVENVLVGFKVWCKFLMLNFFTLFQEFCWGLLKNPCWNDSNILVFTKIVIVIVFILLVLLGENFKHWRRRTIFVTGFWNTMETMNGSDIWTDISLILVKMFKLFLYVKIILYTLSLLVISNYFYEYFNI